MKRLLLGGDRAAPQQRVEIQHLVGRFVDDLLREQIFDRGWKVVDLQALTPTAVDVIKHPFKGPQPADQPSGGGSYRCRLPRLRRSPLRLGWRGFPPGSCRSAPAPVHAPAGRAWPAAYAFTVR